MTTNNQLFPWARPDNPARSRSGWTRDQAFRFVRTEAVLRLDRTPAKKAAQAVGQVIAQQVPEHVDRLTPLEIAKLTGLPCSPSDLSRPCGTCNADLGDLPIRTRFHPNCRPSRRSTASKPRRTPGRPAKMKPTKDPILCACGCRKPLPAGATRRKRFLSGAHRLRAHRVTQQAVY